MSELSCDISGRV